MTLHICHKRSQRRRLLRTSVVSPHLIEWTTTHGQRGCAVELRHHDAVFSKHSTTQPPTGTMYPRVCASTSSAAVKDLQPRSHIEY